MENVFIYIHGKGGSADESRHYQSLIRGSDVVGLDYRSQTPWEAREEFPALFDDIARNYGSVSIIANSIGALFSMSALPDKQIDQAFFISPVVDMEKLICDMLLWSGVSEEELRLKKEIKTDFGETLSWDYLCYVREHPLRWHTPTHILYGGKDTLTSHDTISAFAARTGASLTVMENGEHWFHTEEQMRFLDNWLSRLRP